MTRQTIVSKDERLLFGKYRCMSVGDVIKKDWSYILWLYEEGVVSFTDDIVSDAYTAEANSSPPEEFYWEPG